MSLFFFFFKLTRHPVAMERCTTLSTIKDLGRSTPTVYGLNAYLDSETFEDNEALNCAGPSTTWDSPGCNATTLLPALSDAFCYGSQILYVDPSFGNPDNSSMANTFYNNLGA